MPDSKHRRPKQCCIAASLLIIASVASAAAQSQSTKGDCSPSVAGVQGNVTVNCSATPDQIDDYMRDLGIAHNLRYGFWMEYPAAWQGEQLPANSDGFTFTDPTNQAVVARAFSDSGAYLDQPTADDLSNPMIFYKPRLVELYKSYGDKIIEVRNAQIRIGVRSNGKTIETDRIDAVRLIVDTDQDGRKVRALRYATYYKGYMYFAEYAAPPELFDRYKKLFFRLGYGFVLEPDSPMSH